MVMPNSEGSFASTNGRAYAGQVGSDRGSESAPGNRLDAYGPRAVACCPSWPATALTRRSAGASVAVGARAATCPMQS